MTGVPRDVPAATDVLTRRVETYLTVARAGLRGADLELAERLVDCLRQLVAATATASAADRARVRAAVHALVLRREAHGRVLPRRSLAAAQQVINQVVRQLGRPDLVVPSTPDAADDTAARALLDGGTAPALLDQDPTHSVDSACTVG
ncbi:hypothetical protein GCM10022225_02350 [Plantactinospora mayteni]|uniref:NPH3 domain-containing protein n=1 Tax=Plantactinospora mayteni TaxID=566021 RepID=A0ABQ4EQ08_9ACTN|nr:hypothetical protein Pma05_32960 [Plantactinospora mayteni]